MNVTKNFPLIENRLYVENSNILRFITVLFKYFEG